MTDFLVPEIALARAEVPTLARALMEVEHLLSTMTSRPSSCAPEVILHLEQIEVRVLYLLLHLCPSDLSESEFRACFSRSQSIAKRRVAARRLAQP